MLAKTWILAVFLLFSTNARAEDVNWDSLFLAMAPGLISNFAEETGFLASLSRGGSRPLGLSAAAVTTAAVSGLLLGDALAPVLLGDRVLEEDETTGLALLKRSFDSSDYPYNVVGAYTRDRNENRFALVSSPFLSAASDRALKPPQVTLAFESEAEARAYLDEKRAEAAR